MQLEACTVISAVQPSGSVTSLGACAAAMAGHAQINRAMGVFMDVSVIGT
ncbi:hypothetical protein Lokhon_00792 [Limimaricola hongkongensis DSM 17492]|uniref:Uncharacterized protein n=1 Tax=Limimaricola hongkongensis DSM 17492 TaxID=1122180 RepID=A0A017HHJ4_9RHOB|nr:hypothetical protein Lokhon_00792 [Limimaricola hongkongensis DSM 17492]